MPLKGAPIAVRVAAVVSGFGILASLVGLVALVIDPERGSGFWQVYSVSGSSFLGILVGCLAGLCLSGLLLFGLSQRRRWAQFLGITLCAWSAGDWLADIVSGVEAFALSTTPLLLWLAYELFRAEGWFATEGRGSTAMPAVS